MLQKSQYKFLVLGQHDKRTYVKNLLRSSEPLIILIEVNGYHHGANYHVENNRNEERDRKKGWGEGGFCVNSHLRKRLQDVDVSLIRIIHSLNRIIYWFIISQNHPLYTMFPFSNHLISEYRDLLSLYPTLSYSTCHSLSHSLTHSLANSLTHSFLPPSSVFCLSTSGGLLHTRNNSIFIPL